MFKHFREKKLEEHDYLPVGYNSDIKETDDWENILMPEVSINIADI